MCGTKLWSYKINHSMHFYVRRYVQYLVLRNILQTYQHHSVGCWYQSVTSYWHQNAFQYNSYQIIVTSLSMYGSTISVLVWTTVVGTNIRYCKLLARGHPILSTVRTMRHSITYCTHPVCLSADAASGISQMKKRPTFAPEYDPLFDPFHTLIA